jgi:hypothetical protein
MKLLGHDVVTTAELDEQLGRELAALRAELTEARRATAVANARLDRAARWLKLALALGGAGVALSIVGYLLCRFS